MPIPLSLTQSGRLSVAADAALADIAPCRRRAARCPDGCLFISHLSARNIRVECAVVIVHHCGIEGTRPRGHARRAAEIAFVALGVVSAEFLQTFVAKACAANEFRIECLYTLLFEQAPTTAASSTGM